MRAYVLNSALALAVAVASHGFTGATTAPEPAPASCAAFHNGLVVCTPLVSPEGGKRLETYEDGTATYADCWVYDSNTLPSFIFDLDCAS